MSDYHDFFNTQRAVLQQADLYCPHPNPTFHNPVFERACFRVLIVRLSPFRDVDRSTPHLFLYQAVRRALPDAYIDMAFFPLQHDRQIFDEESIPFLVGVQSYHSVEDFDLILISNAYTLELVNLPYVLLHSHIPIMASQRAELRPIFILGGSNAMAAQAVIAEDGDSIVDAIFLGEGERQVGQLVRSLSSRAQQSKRARLLQAAVEVSGLWVAGDGEGIPVKKAICEAPRAGDLLVDYPILNGTQTEHARLQINFGCPAFCSFCFEGYDRKPYREVPLDDVMQVARRLKCERGASVLEMYSFNFNTHAAILMLILKLSRLFERVSFKSQRVDVLYTTPGLLQAEILADKRSFTLGIEGISERQRAFLHKSLSTSVINATLAALMQQKIREIKLFYILTGHEDEADLAEFRRFVADVKALRKRLNRGIRIIFSFGRLIRMPFTPLRYDRLFLDEDTYGALTGLVKSTCETNGFEFRLATPWEEYCTSQVFAIGGYWLLEPLIALAAEGHYYDMGLTAGYWVALRAWMESHGYWNDQFLGEKQEDYPFALDFVAPEISPNFLYLQYQLALAGTDEGYCLGTDTEPGYCRGCGACFTTEQRQAILGHVMHQPDDPDYWRQLEDLVHLKRRLSLAYVKLGLPQQVAGVTPEWLNAWVLRTLLETRPNLADNLLSVEEVLFATRENRPRYASFYGETVFALKAWDLAQLLQALETLSAEKSGFSSWEVARDFEPGVFKTAHLDLVLPVQSFPAFGKQLRDFLRGNYVPVNFRRDGEGYCLDLPAKSLKKKVVFGGSYVADAAYIQAQLSVGPKFNLVQFLNAFGGLNHYRLASVAISDLSW